MPQKIKVNETELHKLSLQDLYALSKDIMDVYNANYISIINEEVNKRISLIFPDFKRD